MCGILLVKSKQEIPLEQHLTALHKLESRGPDFSRYQYKNNIFIAQVVLHITGTDDYYNQEHNNFLAYNGEIYNYKDLGAYANDIEFVDDAVNNDVRRLKDGWGPWAWAWTNNTTVRYAADPQGEKTLYQYQDDSILIVCSEVAPILEYITGIKIPLPYVNKSWTILDQTPWKDITRITAGKMYINGSPMVEIDSIHNWITSPIHTNINEAYEDFRHIWNSVTKTMTPACQAGLTYSGGLDSSIILSHIDDLELYTINNIGKDPIIDCIEDFLTNTEKTKLNVFSINEIEWATEYNQMLSRIYMPASSWSFVGQWIVNKNCKQRVLFTGVGADELFGGYDLYKDLKFNTSGSVSPYSQFGPTELWNKCLSSYNGHAGQATMLMDYWHQVTGVDARGIDLIAGAWGIEPRNPFLAKPVIQLALNLPFEFKVNTVSKPLIRRTFLERWDESLILPKKGFTGHANDSLPYMNCKFDSTGDRMEDWKIIAQKSFYDCKHN